MATTPIKSGEINLRTDTKHITSDGCFQVNDPIFAMPKHGNQVTALTTGKDLFQEIANAIAGAKQFILFTDWQMDYDVELHNRGSSQYQGRFSELLAKKVAEGVEVKALLYDSIEAAVYTHENQVRENLMRLNPKASELGKNGAPPRNPAGNLPVEVALQHPMTGRTVENILFSHHQKSIVIDGKIAFIGGMDVTYGRWCDNNFDVVVDPVKHRINDMYNPCVSAGRRTTAKEEEQTKDWAGLDKPADAKYGLPRPGFAKPYYLISVLVQRVFDMIDRGYTLDQLVALISLMEIDDQLRDFLLQKARELRSLVDAISRTLNHYSDAKLAAAKQLIEGNISNAVKGSIDAEIQLMQVGVRQMNKALVYVDGAISDFVASKGTNFSDWFDTSVKDIKDDMEMFETYRKNPNLMLSDARRLLNDILDLPSQLVDNFVLEEGCQPRMPWQDVHCKIEGPAVHDVFANFVRRWNVAIKDNPDNTGKGIDASNGLDWRLKPLNTKWLARWGDVNTVFGDTSKHGSKGEVSVQVVRSTARLLLEREAVHAPLLPLPNLLGKTTGKTEGYANNKKKEASDMDGVLEAMIHAIRGAEAYIYIETQFFISKCDKSDKFESSIATNPLIEELASRIGLAVQNNKGFHLYVVLPVHPEGNLQSGGVAKQHYWALQTIKRGKKSLIRRVCEKIAIKQHNIVPGVQPDPKVVQALLDAGAWRSYMTFLNLRNWGVTALFPRDEETRARLDDQMPLGQFVITEQVYIHSKLMIVDDAIAIIGSANCNDRSLNGNGDTEIASVIVDNDVKVMDLGNGVKVNTRKFARELRLALWEKHLGLRIEENEYTKGDRKLLNSNSKDKVHPGIKIEHPPRKREQSAIKAATVKLDLPASPATWKAIQSIASDNAKIYEDVFQHTPRNSMKYFSDTQAGWPKRLSRTVFSARIFTTVAAKFTPNKIEAIAKQELRIADFSTLPPQLNSKYMGDGLKMGSQHKAAHKETYKVTKTAGLDGLNSYAVNIPAQLSSLLASSSNPYLPYQDCDVAEPMMLHVLNPTIAKNTGKHDAMKALKELTGFWLEMPLDFGSHERDSWIKGTMGGHAVAGLEHPMQEEPSLAQVAEPKPTTEVEAA